MKLSEAIMLGDTLKKADATTWLSEDGSCGCAFGGALLAVGMNVSAFRDEWTDYAAGEWPSVNRLWPWLTRAHLRDISYMYSVSCRGEATIEDIAAYVRSIEPSELPDLTPPEQERQEEIEAEREGMATEMSGYADPGTSRF